MKIKDMKNKLLNTIIFHRLTNHISGDYYNVDCLINDKYYIEANISKEDFEKLFDNKSKYISVGYTLNDKNKIYISTIDKKEK